MAARGDAEDFRQEIRRSVAAVHASLNRSAALLHNHNRHLSSSRLAKIYNAMTRDYSNGLRALEQVLLAKARMELDNRKLPKNILKNMTISKGPMKNMSGHSLLALVKKLKKQIVAVAKRVTKKTAIKSEAKGISSKKAAIIAKIAGKAAVQIATHLAYKHLRKQAGHKIARKVMKAAKKAGKKEIKKIAKK